MDSRKQAGRSRIKKTRKGPSKTGNRKARSGAKHRDILIYTAEAIALLIAVGCVIGYLLWNSSFTKIDLKDYTVVTLSGYDHFGTAEVHMDVGPTFSDFWSTVSAKADVISDLRNGDTLTISYDFDEQAAKDNRLKVSAEDTSITVEGLEEPNIIDHEKLYSGLNVIQDGLSPRVGLTVENVSDDTFISQIEYSIDSDRIFFADGEEVSITATIPEGMLDSHEYVLADKKTREPYLYMVSEPSSYIMDASYITDPVLDELQSEGLKLLLNSDANEYGLRIFQQEAHIQAQFVGNKTTFRWENAYLISAYFHSVTDEGLQSMDNHANDVRLVYGVTIRQQNGTSAFVEAVVQFTNLFTESDGTLNLNLDSGRLVSCTYRDKNVKELVSGVDDSAYDTVKLTQ